MRKLLFAALAASPLLGCVVSTYEGVGAAPRIPPPPLLVSAKRSPAKPQNPAAAAAGAAAANEPSEIAARHLLVSYGGALRAPPYITRTREEAQARAEQALKRARAGEDFEALVREYTDEPAGREKGGDLGKFTRGAMVKAFGDAAFALKSGEISELVETPFGFHVIQRTE